LCCAILPKGQMFTCGVNMCFNNWKSEQPMLIVMKLCTLYQMDSTSFLRL